MGRLTKRDNDGIAIAPQFEDKTYVMQDDHDKFTGYINSPIVDRLAELEDKLESGQVKELICNVGEIVYGIRESNALMPLDYWVEKFIVEFILIDKDENLYYVQRADNLGCRDVLSSEDFQYGWFLEENQAEARLKELQEKL